MPTTSSAPGASSSSCAPGSAASSGTFAARLRAAQRSKITLARCSISRCGFAIRNSVSAGRRSTGYTRPRSSAIGKGKACKPTSSGAKLHCDAGHRTQGRPVRAARQGVARQLLRRPHARPHHADLEKLTGVAIRRRPIQGLDQRPDPPCHQAVRRQPRRSRARDRPSQGRPSKRLKAASTLSSPPPATTSAWSCAGSSSSCASYC
jgi:hypothetical protein